MPDPILVKAAFSNLTGEETTDTSIRRQTAWAEQQLRAAGAEMCKFRS